MIAKCPCEKCGVNIEFEVEHIGEDVVCPRCGSGTSLRDVTILNPHLLNCPDCRKEVSRLARSCPNCGRPLIPFAGPQRSKATRKGEGLGWLIGGISAGIVLLFIFSMIFASSAVPARPKPVMKVHLSHSATILYVENKDALDWQSITIYLNGNPLDGPSRTFKYELGAVASGHTAEVLLREFSKESTGERFDPLSFKVTQVWIGGNGFDYAGYSF